MQNTQDHLPIVDVRESGIAMMRNGNMAVVLETGAVNFGLLSANEQYAIISSFAGMLNSLSFSIQIVIRSKRLDITDYLRLLDLEYKKQTNPLLASMMMRYRSFIESTVRDNEVLDKQFYIVISISYLELGVTKSADEAFLKKAAILLMPRRDHIVRQLARIGLKATQLDRKQLVKLFFDIYNFDPADPMATQVAEAKLVNTQPVVAAVSPAPAPVQTPPPPAVTPPSPSAPPPTVQPPTPQSQSQPHEPVLNNPALQQYAATSPVNSTQGGPQRRPGNPFVVEELRDDYSRV